MGVEGIERDKKTPYNMQYILKLDKNTKSEQNFL